MEGLAWKPLSLAALRRDTLRVRTVLWWGGWPLLKRALIAFIRVRIWLWSGRQVDHRYFQDVLPFSSWSQRYREKLLPSLHTSDLRENSGAVHGPSLWPKKWDTWAGQDWGMRNGFLLGKRTLDSKEEEEMLSGKHNSLFHRPGAPSSHSVPAVSLWAPCGQTSLAWSGARLTQIGHPWEEPWPSPSNWAFPSFGFMPGSNVMLSQYKGILICCFSSVPYFFWEVENLFSFFIFF